LIVSRNKLALDHSCSGSNGGFRLAEV